MGCRRAFTTFPLASHACDAMLRSRMWQLSCCQPSMGLIQSTCFRREFVSQSRFPLPFRIAATLIDRTAAIRMVPHRVYLIQASMPGPQSTMHHTRLATFTQSASQPNVERPNFPLLRTLIKRLYAKVHPDLFEKHPNEKVILTILLTMV